MTSKISAASSFCILLNYGILKFNLLSLSVYIFQYNNRKFHENISVHVHDAYY